MLRYFILSSVFLLSGCSPDNFTGFMKPAYVIFETILFDDINTLNINTDALTIEKADIVDDMLRLHVSYSGGCKEHFFKMYVAKAILKSDPPQVELFLSHDANNDLCEALITEYLFFDLVPFKNYYKTNYQDEGPVFLRIYAPGDTINYEPKPLYSF